MGNLNNHDKHSDAENHDDGHREFGPWHALRGHHLCLRVFLIKDPMKPSNGFPEKNTLSGQGQTKTCPTDRNVASPQLQLIAILGSQTGV